MALVVKNPPPSAGDLEMGVRSLGWEDPLEEGTATHSSILAWRLPWTGYSPWGRKESDMTSDLAHTYARFAIAFLPVSVF